jgi:hypothetical protein
MESSNFGECFAHYPLKSRPVSRRAYVSLSAQATGLGILAEIAIRALQSPAASTLRPACPALLTSPAWPMRLAVGFAHVHSVYPVFSLDVLLCAISQPVAGLFDLGLVVNGSEPA